MRNCNHYSLCHNSNMLKLYAVPLSFPACEMTVALKITILVLPSTFHPSVSTNEFLSSFCINSSGSDAADFAVSFTSITARGQLGPLGQQIPSMLREVRTFTTSLLFSMISTSLSFEHNLFGNAFTKFSFFYTNACRVKNKVKLSH